LEVAVASTWIPGVDAGAVGPSGGEADLIESTVTLLANRVAIDGGCTVYKAD
jgi:hypothetical protein